LELVGVLVYAEDKEGKDAGDLCGRPETGVKATRCKADIVALDADVVIMTPKLPEDEDLIALLRSGKDVISPVSYFAPEVEGDELMRRIENACKVGGSTLHGAGIDPGFVCDRVPAVLTGVCSKVERIDMIEVFDCSKHPLADMMFNLLGFGKGPEDLHLESPGGLYFSRRLFPAVLYKLARQLGVRLDRVEMGNVQFAFATKDFEIAAGKVGKGKIAGLSFDYTGYVNGNVFLRQRWVHHVGQHLGALPPGWRTAPDPELPVQQGGTPIYEIVLDVVGRPNIHTRMLLTDRDDPVWSGTANALINCIPGVLAAAPGFLHDPVFAPWNAEFQQH
jgi:hypothetical protein